MSKIENIIKSISGLDENFMSFAQKKLDSLTKPQGSLGMLEELAKQIVGITKKETPSLKNKVVFTLAADHGVAHEKVSAFPQEVTAQMVYNFLKGGAAINVLARHAQVRVVVVDMGVAQRIQLRSISHNFKDRKINYGTKNMVEEEAMTKEEAVTTIEAGIELFLAELYNEVDIIGMGEMGIGNTTSASVITASITGREAEDVTGRGTGIDDKTFENKINVVKRTLLLRKPSPKDALDILSKVGGFEIGGLVGIMLASAAHRIPIVIDGFISGSAALLAYTFNPHVKDYMIAAHCSVEKGHKVILEYMGLKPVLDLDLRLGEGTGAVLAMNIVEASVKILNEMATFQDAGVSEKTQD